MLRERTLAIALGVLLLYRGPDPLRGCPAGPAAGAPAAEPEPPFEKLLELNAATIFGVEPALQADRVTLRFPGKGLFAKAFDAPLVKGQGFISNADDVKDAATRKILMEGAKGEFSLVGRLGGRAVSRFELADDLRISFRLRAGNLPPNASLTVTLNQQDSKNSIQTSFLQDVTVLDAGKRRRQQAKDKTYAAPPSRWFNQKSPGVPFEIVFKEKKLTISMTKEPEKEGGKDEKIELVTVDGVEKPSSGKVVMEFRNFSFLMSDLVIEGKYARPWVEGQIAKLRKEGKLRLAPPEAVAAAGKEKDKEKDKDKKKPPEGGAASGGPANLPPRPPVRKLGSTNIDEADPEADENL